MFYSEVKQTFVGVEKVKENALAESSAKLRLHMPSFEVALTNRAGRLAILYSRDQNCEMPLQSGLTKKLSLLRNMGRNALCTVSLIC